MHLNTKPFMKYTRLESSTTEVKLKVVKRKLNMQGRNDVGFVQQK